MAQLLVRSVSSSVLCSLMGVTAGLAAAPPGGPHPDKEPGTRRVRKYTKDWTDDYRNHHKVVYLAYTRTLVDEMGAEVVAEIWHGRATGYHENARKAWEGLYQNGKRQGEFTTWAENGTRTGLMQFERGMMHGSCAQWSADGRKIRKETYRRGKLDGETRWWAPDGKLAAVGTYRDGLPWEGAFLEWDPSSPRSRKIFRGYARGKMVSEEAVPGNWW